jgi:hypothetical protein
VQQFLTLFSLGFGLFAICVGLVQLLRLAKASQRFLKPSSPVNSSDETTQPVPIFAAEADRFFDASGNCATVAFWGSAEKAKESLKTLIDCDACIDCYNCRRCFKCTRCTGCFACGGCEDCEDCVECGDCIRCVRCYDCNQSETSLNVDCSDCAYCYGCVNCSWCHACDDCVRCVQSSFCRGVTDLQDHHEQAG